MVALEEDAHDGGFQGLNLGVADWRDLNAIKRGGENFGNDGEDFVLTWAWEVSQSFEHGKSFGPSGGKSVGLPAAGAGKVAAKEAEVVNDLHGGAKVWP